MAHRPSHPAPPLPIGINAALIGAKRPPVGYFLYLYGAVGAPYEWTDWLARDLKEQTAFVHDPKVEFFTCMVDGWPGGFFMLDTREKGICDLAYFGLVPEAAGRGLGPWLLSQAIHMAWDRHNVAKVTVNTCTLDHPRAIGLYQRLGFTPVRREERSRVLTRPREV